VEPRFLALFSEALIEPPQRVSRSSYQGAKEFKHLKEGNLLTPTLIATVVSFVVGYACIKWLMGFLQRRGIVPFVWYRFALGILIFAMCLTGRWDPNASIEATPNVPKEVASSR
jgi:undecaprenyl pyrophosphate phosphatase UppP